MHNTKIHMLDTQPNEFTKLDFPYEIFHAHSFIEKSRHVQCTYDDTKM